MANNCSPEDEDDPPVSTERSLLIPKLVVPGTTRGLYYGRFWSRWLQDRLARLGFGQHGDLQQSWDYFEHYVLPRRLNTTKKKAPPGTNVQETELYPAWTTCVTSEFGTGMAVYFETLKWTAWILFVAWLLYLPSILYYASIQFDPDNGSMWDVFLKGSLMCVHTTWVPCIDCNNNSELENSLPGDRLATATNNNEKDDDPLVFLLKNNCSDMRYQEGLNHLVVVLFLVLSMLYLGFYQKRLEQTYDEDLLTASDYSIVVSNPPSTAVFVDQWKEFFSQFGTVVYCTIALDNERLVQALVERRTILMRAQFQEESAQSSSSSATTLWQSLPSPVVASHPRLARELETIEAKCHRLLTTRQYDATRLFVTFDTERAQRGCLQALSFSKLVLASQNHSVVRPELRFRQSTLLHVQPATMEPSAVRWKDLNESVWVRLLQRGVSTTITLCLLGGALWSVRCAFGNSTTVAALLIAFFSSAASSVFAVVNMLESHQGESSFQASLFCKTAAFRVVNTAIATTIIKPFTYTASVSSIALIPAIYAVLQAEIFVTPLSNMLDPVGQFDRHVCAPLAKNQIAMNSYFRGSQENFGDKYTNMMKILFLCFFYSVLFPSGFLFGAIALAALYYSDKFLLVRRWAPMPELGNDVARISRRFVVPFCLVTLIVVSECYWSAFPFDDVCDADETVSINGQFSSFVGEHELTTLDKKQPQTIRVVVESGDPLFRFCDQNYLAHLTGLLTVYEKETNDWMSPDQEWLTFLFGLVCAVVVVVLTVMLFSFEILPFLRGVTRGGYSTKERDSGQLFSDQDDIKAYVPQVPHPFFPFPLLACDIDKVKVSHIGWRDPLRDHQYYNLHNDIDYLLDGKELDRPVLDVVG